MKQYISVFSNLMVGVRQRLLAPVKSIFRPISLQRACAAISDIVCLLRENRSEHWISPIVWVYTNGSDFCLLHEHNRQITIIAYHTGHDKGNGLENKSILEANAPAETKRNRRCANLSIALTGPLTAWHRRWNIFEMSLHHIARMVIVEPRRCKKLQHFSAYDSFGSHKYPSLYSRTQITTSISQNIRVSRQFGTTYGVFSQMNANHLFTQLSDYVVFTARQLERCNHFHRRAKIVKIPKKSRRNGTIVSERRRCESHDQLMLNSLPWNGSCHAFSTRRITTHPWLCADASTISETWTFLPILSVRSFECTQAPPLRVFIGLRFPMHSLLCARHVCGRRTCTSQDHSIACTISYDAIRRG